MSCSVSYNKLIKWKIEYNSIKPLYKYLYDSIEHGGKFNIDVHSKKTDNVIRSNKGEADSVESPLAIINWHTHPISCYIAEKTVYGWPSGEDLRETLIYGLQGSACHVVPSVEGIYVMQPNPCVLLGLANITEKVDEDVVDVLTDFLPGNKHKRCKIEDFLRGIYVILIEIYFRSSHVYRTYDYVLKHGITTDNYIDFVNTFELNKLINNFNLLDYVKTHEKKTEIIGITSKGRRIMTGIKLLKVLNLFNEKSSINQLINSFKLGQGCKLPKIYKNSPIKKWNTEQTFKMTLYPNYVIFNDITIDYSKLNNHEKWQFLNDVKTSRGVKTSQKDEKKYIFLKNDEDITFYMFDMNGNCSHENIKNHLRSFNFGTRTSSRTSKRSKRSKRSKKRSKRSKKPLIEVVSCKKYCGHCKDAEERSPKFESMYKIVFHDFPSIEEAINHATEKAGTSVPGIPAFFKNGKYSKKPLF